MRICFPLAGVCHVEANELSASDRDTWRSLAINARHSTQCRRMPFSSRCLLATTTLLATCVVAPLQAQVDSAARPTVPPTSATTVIMPTPTAIERIPGMAVAAVAVAALTQASGTPKGWARTWGGYARRVGDQAGFIAIEETVRLSLGATVRWTPDTQPCSGRARAEKWRALLPRLGCAVRETVLLRTPDGHARPNFPLVFGAASAAAISTTWRPDADTPAHAVSVALTRTAFVLTGNVISHLISDWRKDWH
jgi:hypothetical protein